MKIFLTSHTGGSKKENGKRVSMPMSEVNGFVHKLQKEWVEDSKVLIIAGSELEGEAYKIKDGMIFALQA